ncbi:phosphopantothenoylcysteine decarboxylase domain-containing protein [Zavarzinella formosa]|uniref:phosphopantothenoylcysteine decarboxylase domain-containing protein n=1 Tax=Zavarzinella formosa TaxID=360055 RepID=UPI0002E07307|nr:phosphopantothenoylcysteine decarboxylase [Zavarzinella formosa]
MNILVTAGNTQTPIDRVRCITNIFSGKTGGHIAAVAAARGHLVTALTSHPESVPDPGALKKLRPYRTFEELERLMAEEIPNGGYDAVIHAAAVSDYHLAGVYAPAPGSAFDPETAVWQSNEGSPRMIDTAAGKVKSHHPELWLRLKPAPKLVDRIRRDWNFAGLLVKFKLEVGVTDDELRDIAEKSRQQSYADLMVANTLEGMHDWAFIGAGSYDRVSRPELAVRLLTELERPDRLKAKFLTLKE